MWSLLLLCVDCVRDPLEAGRESAKTSPKKVNPDGEACVEVERDWKAFKKVGTLCAKTWSSSRTHVSGTWKNPVWLEARGSANGEIIWKHIRGNNSSKLCYFNSLHSCVNMWCLCTKKTGVADKLANIPVCITLTVSPSPVLAIIPGTKFALNKCKLLLLHGGDSL